MNPHINANKNRLLSLLTVSALLLPLPLMTACSNDDSAGSSEATSHIERAETYADQRQYRSALLEIRNAIKADPDNVSHVIRLAELYLSIGANREASDLLEPWLEDQPQEVALLLARAYVSRGKHLSAQETLEQYKPGGPEQQTRVSLVRAEALRVSGDRAEALSLYRNLMANHPSNVDAILGTARTLIDLNQPGQALRTIEDWLQQNSPVPEVRYWKGMAEYQENNLEAAAQTLTDAASDLPSSDVFLPVRRNILTLLSRVLTEQGKTVDAQVYNKILAENRNNDAVEQGNAATTALKEGNIDEAKRILGDMLSMNPENRQAALMLGALATSTGDTEKGSRLLSENLDPETTSTPFLRAATMAQIDIGEREQALETLERALKARPEDNEILAMHGILALSMPEHQDTGVASLSKAIANEPDRVRLRLALARHYLGKERPEQALAQLRMAFTSQPAAWTTTGTYLNLLIQQGEIKEAEEIRDSLLNGYPDEPNALFLASMADARLGNIDEAITRLRQLDEENPDLSLPKQALASLYAQNGENEQAVEMQLAAARLTPDAIRPLQQAGQIYARDHSTEDVERWLNRLAEDSPELAKNANTLSAIINISQGELEQARNLLNQWQDTESSAVRQARVQLLVAEARAAVQSGNYQKAREKAAEAIALAPENVNFALLPVSIAEMEGNTDKAFDALDAVEENFGEQQAVVFSRAALLEKHLGTAEAHDYLAKQWQSSRETELMPALIRLAKQEAPDSVDQLTDSWLEAAPDSVAAHLARAEWLMTNEQELQAANHYEQVLSRQPDNVGALNNLAWLLRQDDTSRAAELASRARELAPENPAVLDTYGWILHLSGKHSDAREAIEEALRLAPDNAEIQSHLEAVKNEDRGTSG